MSTHRNRISRTTAEHLLDGAHGAPKDLADMLRAAAAPGSAAELAGEHQALAVLRAARLAPDPAPRRTRMLKAAIAQLIAAKFAATAAVAAAATGGLALAAATGSLPSPLQHAAHSAFGAPNPHSNGHATIPTLPAAASSHPASDAPAAQDSPTDAGATPTTTPSPSLTGLCTAYQHGAANSNGKALDNPAFTVLITAAGGKDNVASYCTTLVGTPTSHPTGEPSDLPSHPTGQPSDLPSHPTGAATTPDHPTGEATTPDHPTGAPTNTPSHPSGEPSSLTTHR